MKLIPKTRKGKNKIREAGTDEWTILRNEPDVPCLGGVSGLFIAPRVDDEEMAQRKARWIKKFHDPDFDIQES